MAHIEQAASSPMSESMREYNTIVRNRVESKLRRLLREREKFLPRHGGLR